MNNSAAPEPRPTAVPSDAFIGKTIEGKYTIECRVGRGGMGAVYRARHLMLGKTVAIKILPPELVADRVMFDRFRREAQAISSLEHPNVVNTKDFGLTPDNVAYLVMEYVEGQTLRKMLSREKPLPPSRVLALMKQICAAVQAAHNNGIIHRDLKPENVMARVEEGRETAKVLDFGIAKLWDANTSVSLQTDIGSLVGTPQYMSPEQCEGGAIDARSDIYSLGVMAYEMLVGTVPFTGKSPAAIMVQHVAKEPPRLRDTAPRFGATTEACLLRALAKQPADRQASAAEFAAELEAALSAESDVPAPAIESPTENLIPTGDALDALLSADADVWPEDIFSEEIPSAGEVSPEPPQSESVPGSLPVLETLSATEENPDGDDTPPPVEEHLMTEEVVLDTVTVDVPPVGAAPLLVSVTPPPTPRTWADLGRLGYRVVRWTTSGLGMLLIFYIGAVIGFERYTCHRIQTDFATILADPGMNIQALRANLRAALVQRGVDASEQDLRIRIDPPNRRVTVVVAYECRLLAVPMRYRIEESVEGPILPLGVLARLPADEFEIVDVSPEELDGFRAESGKK